MEPNLMSAINRKEGTQVCYSGEKGCLKKDDGLGLYMLAKLSLTTM